MSSIRWAIEHDAIVLRPGAVDVEPIPSRFGDLVWELSHHTGISKILYDLSNAESIYYDAIDIAVPWWVLNTSPLLPAPPSLEWHILVSSREALRQVIEMSDPNVHCKLAVATRPLNMAPLPLDVDHAEELTMALRELRRKDKKARDPVKGFLELNKKKAGGLVEEFLDVYSRPSILGLISIHFGENQTLVARPYHAYSAYRIGLGGDTLLARPAIASRSDAAFRRREIEEFTTLMNSPQVTEARLQRFFEMHEHFLRGVNPNLCRAYPQVFLRRIEGGPLRPDFVLEPVEGKWCDVLDIKLPSVPLVVGSRNRRRLSSAVLEGIGQLQEYQRYFEDPRHRDRFRELMRSKGALNLDCYYPRLALVIGMDPTTLDEDAIRRQLMTMYPDIQIVTYEQVLEHARRHILL